MRYLFILLFIMTLLSCGDDESTKNNLCDPNPCNLPNKTVCIPIGEHFECHCDDGYVESGHICIEKETKSCEETICEDNEICDETGGTPICICEQGYTDTEFGCILDCSYKPNSSPDRDNLTCICNSNYIEDENGICKYDCSNIANSSVNNTNDGCICNDGYFMNDQNICEELEVDPCDPNPCNETNRTACQATGEDQYICNCDNGYHEDDQGECVETVSPCNPNPCTETGQTVCIATGNEAGDYICNCSEGYHEDGSGGCLEDVNPCDPNPCTETGQTVCIAEGVDINDYSCECSDGYHEDGSGGCLEDVNPCEPNPCNESNRTVCIAEGIDIGDYSCQCDSGYHENSSNICVETVDPCDPNPCNETNRTVCQATGNEAGQYICNCDSGYHENSSNICVETVDPCDPNPCNETNRTVCQATGNEAGQYICNCDEGFEEDQNGICQLLSTLKLRLMAGNISSGNYQSYDLGHGIRIFKGTKPDIAMVQEFNYGSNTSSDLREFVDRAFGTEFYYSIDDSSFQIPNGIVSRYEIVDSGYWNDPYLSNRELAWAIVDIPGEKDLFVVSVHLHTDPSSDQVGAAQVIACEIKDIMDQLPNRYYYVVGGDFNGTASVSSNGFGYCNGTKIFETYPSGDYPEDEEGYVETNATGSKHYDFVLVSPDLEQNQISTVYTHKDNEQLKKIYPTGLVFRSNLYSQTELDNYFYPVEQGDSTSSNMQHMGVVRDFEITIGN